mgnify:CR=1 FL=1
MQTFRNTLASLSSASLLFVAVGAQAQEPVQPADRVGQLRVTPNVRAQRPIPQPPTVSPSERRAEQERRREAARAEEQRKAEEERRRQEEARQRPPSNQQPTGQQQAQTQQQDSRERREAARRQGRFQLDFNKAEIQDVVQTISDFTGRLFIVPENIRGRITIIGPEDGTGLVTADEAYAAFLAALEANNWTVYPVGPYLKLVEKRSAAQSNVWTYVEPGSTPPADERMVTKIIRLKHIDTDTVVNPLKQLMSKDATVIPMPPDTLIVTEVALNLRRIERILEALDQPGGGEELRIIQLEYASASEIAEKLSQIFEPTSGPGARARPVARPAGGEGAAGGDSGAGAATVSRIIPDDRTNKLIVFANRKGFEQVETLLRQLDVPTGDTGRVHVYYLANANAEDLANTLQTLLQGQQASQTARPIARRPREGAPSSQDSGAAIFTGDIKISADPATNSLVIVASAQDYRNLVRVIEQLDIPRRQVFVEAVIMEVNLRDNTEFGFNFHGGAAIETTDGIAPIVIGNQVGQASSLNLSSLLSMGGFLAGIQGSPVPAVAELGINLPSFGVILHALTTSSDVNVLSTPHILTSDNEEAEITVGQNVPFQAGYAPQGLANLLTGTTTNTGSLSGLLGSSIGAFGLSSLYAPIQRQNVELKLKIKPQINESDYVRLEVEQQTEEIAEQDPVLGPTTARRTAKTVIVAKDQTTVVIGGLVQERTIKSVAKTPILGDIPVVGRLFRDNSTSKVKTNLLLFLTPYIIRNQDDFRRIFERKMRERQQFIATFYGTSPEYEVPIDFARKAGPLALLSRDVEQEMQRLENGGPGAPGEIRIQPRTTEPPEAMPEESTVPMEDVPEPAAPAEEQAPAP